jgi:hypothetical protein
MTQCHRRRSVTVPVLLAYLPTLCKYHAPMIFAVIKLILFSLIPLFAPQRGTKFNTKNVNYKAFFIVCFSGSVLLQAFDWTLECYSLRWYSNTANLTDVLYFDTITALP